MCRDCAVRSDGGVTSEELVASEMFRRMKSHDRLKQLSRPIVETFQRHLYVLSYWVCLTPSLPIVLVFAFSSLSFLPQSG